MPVPTSTNVRRRAPAPFLMLPAELILKTLDGLAIEDILSVAQTSFYPRCVVASSLQVWLNASNASLLISSLPLSIHLPSSTSCKSNVAPSVLLFYAARLVARSRRFVHDSSIGSLTQPRHSSIFSSPQFSDLQILSVSPNLYFFFSRTSEELLAYIPDEERFVNVGGRVFERAMIKHLDCEVDRRIGRVVVAILAVRNVRTDPAMTLEVYSFTISTTYSPRTGHAITALVSTSSHPFLSIPLPPSSSEPSLTPRSLKLATFPSSSTRSRPSSQRLQGVIVLPSSEDILLVNLTTGRSARMIIPFEDMNIVSASLNPSTLPSSSSPAVAHELILVLSTPSSLVIHSLPLPPALYDFDNPSSPMWSKVAMDRSLLERGQVYTVEQGPNEAIPKILNIRSCKGSGRTWSFDVVKTGVTHRRVFVRPSMSVNGVKQWKAVDVREDRPTDRAERKSTAPSIHPPSVSLVSSLHQAQYPPAPMMKPPFSPSPSSPPRSEHAIPRRTQPRVIRKTFGGKQCTVKGYDAVIMTPSPTPSPVPSIPCKYSSDYSSYSVSIQDFRGPDLPFVPCKTTRTRTRMEKVSMTMDLSLALPQLPDDPRGWKVLGWDTVCGRVILSSPGAGGGICVVGY
ncbi:hypothetical protein SISSUDRAFT_1053865 [Sistotremastrum suecicum HHB10207 ss-3]|uniref:F-box domain-containing protein n=1 Tax=Sistotremastrum suecicum HHB10207 ss-3 TaxID=1314776 RepID=A0A165YXD3_9AGAM|nr:hypothetical protein SISSUDRAFT_1053865 [Sistotremastrum suecicum HHB10207 ss-3]